MNRRPDLIVPIRDRRQHRRYLTLKNFAIACAVAVAAFIGISIYSEVRRPAPNDYGRLVKREAPAPPVAVKPLEVVPEATPIDDQSSADPTLVEPMRREQWLREDTTSAAVIEPVPAPAPVSTIQHGEDVVVVNGPEGVTVVKQKRRGPVLSGGFGQ